MRIFLLILSLVINVSFFLTAAGPGLVTRANPNVEGIGCPGCQQPSTQKALVAAALQGRAGVLGSLPTANQLMAFAVANVLLCAIALFWRRPLIDNSGRSLT
jgi:hypothetical protein